MIKNLFSYTCVYFQCILFPYVSFYSREDFLRIPELAINPLGDRIVHAFFQERYVRNSSYSCRLIIVTVNDLKIGTPKFLKK